MMAAEYDHIQGHKLSQQKLDEKAAEGWKVLSHVVSADDHHTYVFKRMKEVE